MNRSPVKIGFCGVVCLNESTQDLSIELDLLDSLFHKSDSISSTAWRGDKIAAISYQQVGECGYSAGRREFKIPEKSGCRGVFYGTLFKDDKNEKQDPVSLSNRLIDIYISNDITNYQKINGGWAGILVDDKKNCLYFIRDQIGVTPLYVFRDTDHIYFATDLRLIPRALTSNINKQAVIEFLHYLYVPAPLSLYANCTAVLPGHILLFDGQVSQKKYAQNRFVLGNSLQGEDKVNKEIRRQLPIFESHLLKAVEDCLPSTGKIALTLSGGKDSSALAIALSKICPERVLALTIGQSDKDIDETSDAKTVCNALGIEHMAYYPSDEEIQEGFYEFTSILDQPIGDPATLPYFLGMSQLPEDCGVILDGTGNDYYFGVTSIPRGLWKYKKRTEIENRLPSIVWKSMLKIMELSNTKLSRLAKDWSTSIEEAFVAWHGWSGSELNKLYKDEVSFKNTYLWSVMKKRKVLNHIELETEVICGVWEPHTAFRKAEYTAHALGKGIRFPFTDNRLARYVNALPVELKLKNNINKQILRAYLKDNLPGEIVSKKKMGFVFDLNRILNNSSYKWIEYLLDYKGVSFSENAKDEIYSVLNRYRENDSDPSSQHKLYTLMLLTFLLASKKGIKLDF